MRRKKISKSKQIEGRMESAIIVNMEKRSGVRICIPEEKDIVDSEILQLRTLAQKQREEIKRAYYSVNTPISNTIDRTFLDLFKRFVQLKLEDSKKQ